MNTEHRRLLFKLVQYTVGILALVWVVTQVKWSEAFALLSDLSYTVLFIVIGITVLQVLCQFSTWHVLINRFARTSFKTAASVKLTVTFINQLFPSRLSGRAAAPVVLKNQAGLCYADAVAVSGVHTGLYAVLYGLISLLGVLFLAVTDLLTVSLVGLLLLSTGLYLLAGLLVLIAGTNMHVMNRFVAIVDHLALRIPGTTIGSRLSALIHRVPDFTEDSAESFRSVVGSWAVLGGYALGWIGAQLIGPGVRVWILLTALGAGAGIDPVLFPFYLVAAYSVTLLPLTPGGIGVTEAAASAVFIALGVPSEIIVPVIFIDRFLGVYLPALGGWYPSMQLDLSTKSPD